MKSLRQLNDFYGKYLKELIIVLEENDDEIEDTREHLTLGNIKMGSLKITIFN